MSSVLGYFQPIQLVKQLGLVIGEMGSELACLVFHDSECKFDDGGVFLGLFEVKLEHAGDHTEPRWFEVLHIDGFGEVDDHDDCSERMHNSIFALGRG